MDAALADQSNLTASIAKTKTAPAIDAMAVLPVLPKSTLPATHK